MTIPSPTALSEWFRGSTPHRYAARHSASPSSSGSIENNDGADWLTATVTATRADRGNHQHSPIMECNHPLRCPRGQGSAAKPSLNHTASVRPAFRQGRQGAQWEAPRRAVYDEFRSLHSATSPPGMHVTRLSFGPIRPHASYSICGATASSAPLPNTTSRFPTLPTSAEVTLSSTNCVRWMAAFPGDSGSNVTMSPVGVLMIDSVSMRSSQSPLVRIVKLASKQTRVTDWPPKLRSTFTIHSAADMFHPGFIGMRFSLRARLPIESDRLTMSVIETSRSRRPAIADSSRTMRTERNVATTRVVHQDWRVAGYRIVRVGLLRWLR